MSTAANIVEFAGWWLLIGAAVAVPFLAFGIDRIDANARGSYTFRPLVVPGVLLLWPLVLWRWWALERDGAAWRYRHTPWRGLHAPLWIVLGVALPAALVALIVFAPRWPADAPAVQLSPGGGGASGQFNGSGSGGQP